MGKDESRSGLREKVTNAGTEVNLLRRGLVMSSCDDCVVAAGSGVDCDELNNYC